MANTVYPKVKGKLWTGALNWTSDTIKVVFVDTGNYTYNASHEFLSDIPTAARVAISGALTGKSVSAEGLVQADDVTTTMPSSGPTVEALVVFKDTGTETTSPLIAYIDTVSEGLPFTPAGAPVTIVWPGTPKRVIE